MRYAWLVFVGATVAPGCRQILGIDPPRLAADGGDTDGSSGNLDAPDAPADASGYCYGPSGFAMCFDTAPTGTPVLNSTLNTGTSTLCAATIPTSWTDAGQPAVCLIAGDTIAISSNLRVTGTRALALVAASTITVSATVDASGHANLNGPGAAAPVCASQLPASPGTMTFGAGGGAGGTLATPGANGGDVSGSMGAACPATPDTSPLRAGARGEAGGLGYDGFSASNGGASGGVVFLAAGTSISISGVINASGGGGGAGQENIGAGGAGGGAGGMIAIYAPEVTAIGTLMANGGGGGTGNAGQAGGDPQVSSPLVGGAGGMYMTNPSGGNGCGHGTPATVGGNGSGAGGGGGGCGFILSNVPTIGETAIVSPGVSPF